ncbi:phage capsid protein [Klebsiella pneumoniae]
MLFTTAATSPVRRSPSTIWVLSRCSRSPSVSGDTVWDLPDAGTRNALMADYGVFVPVEKRDLRKLLADPQGPYLQLTLAASNRKKTMLSIVRCLIPFCAKPPILGRTLRLPCQRRRKSSPAVPG